MSARKTVLIPKLLTLSTISFALFVGITQTKVVFNKDLNITGDLSAVSGDFSSLTVHKMCSVDNLLSADTINSDIVDTKELYADLI